MLLFIDSTWPLILSGALPWCKISEDITPCFEIELLWEREKESVQEREKERETEKEFVCVRERERAEMETSHERLNFQFDFWVDFKN